MDKKELDAILEKHQKWLNNEGGGERADLSRKDLHDMILTNLNLNNSNLLNSDLHNSDLRFTDLSNSDLHTSDLHNSDLNFSNLCKADLRGVNFRNADLRMANLNGADLRMAILWFTNISKADLRGADLDYSVFPLWCGSFDIIVDTRIAAQLAYHFCRLKCDDPEYIKARNAIVDFANKFHRVNECGKLEKIELPKTEPSEKSNLEMGIKEHLIIDGHEGKWYVIDEKEYDGSTLYLLESENYGDEAACIIVNEKEEVVLDDVWNGFSDYDELIVDQESEG